MATSNRLTAAAGLSAVLCLSLGACTQPHAEAPPVAALPPPPPPVAPPQPPSADEALQKQLTQLGAVQGADGWDLALATASFHGTKLTLQGDDQDKVDKVTELLKNTPNLRIVIDGYSDGQGSLKHQTKESQLHANALLRDLTANGADAGRVQAVGKGADQTKHGIELNFSDAQGQFPSTSPAAANN